MKQVFNQLGDLSFADLKAMRGHVMGQFQSEKDKARNLNNDLCTPDIIALPSVKVHYDRLVLLDKEISERVELAFTNPAEV